MRVDPIIRRWHRRIIKDAESILGRAISPVERQFIVTRGGCIALEMIHDTVKFATATELHAYLNSEAKP